MAFDPNPAAEDLVLWDVIDEHLDETEFGLELLDEAFEHSTRRLADLARYPEERLFAHLDALIVGGVEVVETRLVPELSAPDPARLARVTAAALPLVISARHDRLRPVLSDETAGAARAALRAAELASNPKLEAWVCDRLNEALPAAGIAALLEFSAARGFPTPPLLAYLQSEEPVLVLAAARAALAGDAAMYLPVLEYLLEQTEGAIREAALIATLAWGSARAWAACERLALDRERAEPFAMTLYAALGNRAQHEKLAAQLASPSHRPAALFALGYSGDVAQLPRLVEQLGSEPPHEKKLAAQAISLIVGIDLSDPAFALPPATPALRAPKRETEELDASLPPIDEDDLDADLVPGPENALPEPNAAAIASYVAAQRGAFDPAQRYLGGARFGLGAALDYLERAPLRRRHALALELCVRTGAKLRLNTRLFSATQRGEIARARALGSSLSLRAFNRW